MGPGLRRGDEVNMSSSTAPQQNNWSDLAVRTASGVVMAVVAFSLIWVGGWPFNIACIIIGGLIFWEWLTVTKQAMNRLLWLLGGFVYATSPTLALIYLRNGKHGFTVIPSESPKLAIVMTIMIIVIATDIGAYFSGRLIGGPKLAPTISPKKTWAGFFGGILSALVFSSIIAIIYLIAEYEKGTGLSVFLQDSPKYVGLISALILVVIISIISQMGDLFESWLKRKFGVKDSSNIIPGHGGVMDRLDGVIFAASSIGLLVYSL
jgi:phosphatidate cytidylyltransferase